MAVPIRTSGPGTALAQETPTGPGQLTVGGVVSLTVIVWVQSAWLRSEERRVGVGVIVKRLKQLLALIVSPWKLTVTVPPQPSLAVTLLVSGAGTALAQET